MPIVTVGHRGEEMEPAEYWNENSRKEARRAAVARASFSCPVIKQVKKTLQGDFLDTVEALENIIIDLRRMPEATATIETINDLLKVEKNGER